MNSLRDTVRRQALITEPANFPRVHLRRIPLALQDDICTGKLTVLGMGRPIDQRFPDSGMLVEHGFDLARKDLHPREVDDVLLPSEEEEKAVGIESSKIAGLEPSIRQGFVGTLPGGEVRVEHPTPSQIHLPDSIGIGIHDPGFIIGQNRSDRTSLLGIPRTIDERKPHFNDPVGLGQFDPEFSMKLRASISDNRIAVETASLIPDNISAENMPEFIIIW